MYAAAVVAAGIDAGHRAGGREIIRAFGARVEHLQPRMVHRRVGRVVHIAESRNVVRLFQIHRNVEDGKAALAVLTETDQRRLHLRRGHAGDRQHGYHAVLLERLQAGALTRAVVRADVSVRGDVQDRAVAAALEREHHALAHTGAQVVRRNAGSLGRSRCRRRGILLILVVLVLVLYCRRSGCRRLARQHLNADQIALCGLDRRVVECFRLEGQVFIGLHRVVQTGGDGDLAGTDVLAGADLGVGNCQRAGSVQRNNLIEHALDGRIRGGLAVEQFDDIARIEAVCILERQVGAIHIEHLGLRLAGRYHGHAHFFRPCARVRRGHAQHAGRQAGCFRITRHCTHDIGARAAVHEELLDRIGQITGIAIACLAQVAAIHARVVGKAGDQLRLADHRAALRQADKTRCAGADALHRGRA